MKHQALINLAGVLVLFKPKLKVKAARAARRIRIQVAIL